MQSSHLASVALAMIGLLVGFGYSNRSQENKLELGGRGSSRVLQEEMREMQSQLNVITNQLAVLLHRSGELDKSQALAAVKESGITIADNAMDEVMGEGNKQGIMDVIGGDDGVSADKELPLIINEITLYAGEDKALDEPEAQAALAAAKACDTDEVDDANSADGKKYDLGDTEEQALQTWINTGIQIKSAGVSEADIVATGNSIGESLDLIAGDDDTFDASELETLSKLFPLAAAGDQFIDKDEAATLAQKTKAADVNGDGDLSPEEEQQLLSSW